MLGLAVAVGAALALHFGPKAKRDAHSGDAIRQIEARVEAKRRPKWLAALRTACSAPGCGCSKKAAAIALDADALDPVLAVVAHARSCAPVEFDGFRAEALVRKNDPSGLELVSKILAGSTQNPNALYALALSSYRGQRLTPALELAEAAERAGRGWSATLLVGLVAYESGDFARARASFRILLRDDPDDVDALFNLGVTAQRENRYGEARSSYLRVARLEPGHADARHNLVILTHSFGAVDEAAHHFAKFRELAPNDPRIAALEAVLAKPPEHGQALTP
jgi:tetratricopeptide (TPR) repeat protein